MRRDFKIVTVGFNPAWDITCLADGLDWGEHKVVKETIRPAGKALNVSRALAWTGVRSVAAGLWGKSDFRQMLGAMRPLKRMVKMRMTPADGSTRQNITIVDTAQGRDMHLRNKSELATGIALRKMRRDLKGVVVKGGVCVFAGAMPEGKLLDEAVSVIKSCRDAGAKVVVDTSGIALKKIVGIGNLWLIKPNVDELGELLGEPATKWRGLAKGGQIEDEANTLVKAAKELLDKVEIVLVSRSIKGVIVVCRQGCWQARHKVARPRQRRARAHFDGLSQVGGKEKTASSTVGCGDFLLAGFLKGMKEKGDVRFALETAVKVAAARAWGWWEEKTWKSAQREISVEIEKF